MIMDWLDINDICSLALTSRSFYHGVRLSTRSLSVTDPTYQLLPWFEKLERLQLSQSMLDQVDLQDICTNTTINDLRLQVKSISAFSTARRQTALPLRHLHICCFISDFPRLDPLLQLASNLQRLEIYHSYGSCNSTLFISSVSRLARLKHLVLDFDIKYRLPSASLTSPLQSLKIYNSLFFTLWPLPSLQELTFLDYLDASRFASLVLALIDLHGSDSLSITTFFCVDVECQIASDSPEIRLQYIKSLGVKFNMRILSVFGFWP